MLGNPTSSASTSSGSRLGGFGPPVSAHIPPPGVVQFQQQLIVPPVGMPQPQQLVQPPQVMAQPPQVMPTPVSAAPPAPPALSAAEALAKVNIEAQAKQQEELQRKLMDGQVKQILNLLLSSCRAKIMCLKCMLFTSYLHLIKVKRNNPILE